MELKASNNDLNMILVDDGWIQAQWIRAGMGRPPDIRVVSHRGSGGLTKAATGGLAAGAGPGGPARTRGSALLEHVVQHWENTSVLAE